MIQTSNGVYVPGSMESVLPFGKSSLTSSFSKTSLSQSPETLKQNLKEFARQVYSHKWDEKTMQPLMLKKELRDQNCKLLESSDLAKKQEVIGDFIAQLNQLRSGKTTGGIAFGKPKNVSLAYATNMFFGKSLNEVLFQLGATDSSVSYGDIAEQLGYEGFSAENFEKDIIEYGNEKKISSFLNSTSENKIYRFLMVEVILNAIRVGLELSAKHIDWISGTISVSKRKVTQPTMKDGDTMVTKLGEGELISMGTVEFDQKDVEVAKVGKGIIFTDDFLFESEVDVVNLFLYKVGVKMAVAEDLYAGYTLVNGDTKDPDIDESAPVIGSQTIGAYSFRDFKRVINRMGAMGNSPDALISGEEEGLDVSDVAEIQGGNFSTSLLKVAGINSNMPELTHYHQLMPKDQIMFLDSMGTMRKLRYRNMRAMKRTNPANDTEELFIYNYIGFMIADRDGRVILDRSLVYDKFPASMDIERLYTEQQALLV